MSALEKLYYGNINPCQKTFDKDSEYGKSMSVITAMETVIKNRLSDSEKCLLVSLMSASADICRITAAENFIIGFKLGARIGLEIVSDDEGCLQDLV